MIPAPELVVDDGSKYALADPERQSMVFLLVGRNDRWDPGDGGPVHLRLSDVPGTFEARWFDPREGIFVEAGLVRGEAPTVLTPPSGDDWLLLLTRR